MCTTMHLACMGPLIIQEKRMTDTVSRLGCSGMVTILETWGFNTRKNWRIDTLTLAIDLTLSSQFLILAQVATLKLTYLYSIHRARRLWRTVPKGWLCWEQERRKSSKYKKKDFEMGMTPTSSISLGPVWNTREQDLGLPWSSFQQSFWWCWPLRRNWVQKILDTSI